MSRLTYDEAWERTKPKRRRWGMPGHGGPGNEPPLLTEKLPKAIKGVTMSVKKKLATTIVGAILVAANEWLGLGIPEETLDRIVALIVGFVVAQGIADHGKEAAKVNAGLSK